LAVPDATVEVVGQQGCLRQPIDHQQVLVHQSLAPDDESVAFIVTDGLDIQSDAWSFGYVASWSGGGDEAIAAIKAAGTRIQRTAAHILSALQLGEGDSPEEPG
jgi:hypothetical protein